MTKIKVNSSRVSKKQSSSTIRSFTSKKYPHHTIINKIKDRPKSASSSEHEKRLYEEQKQWFLSEEELNIVKEFMKGSENRLGNMRKTLDHFYYTAKTNE